MCLAQRHNTVTPVRLEPAAPQSRVEHSTIEPLRSHNYNEIIQLTVLGANDVKEQIKITGNLLISRTRVSKIIQFTVF